MAEESEFTDDIIVSALLADGFVNAPIDEDNLYHLCHLAMSKGTAEDERNMGENEDEYISRLTYRLMTDYSDVFPESLPMVLPPLREVNHQIKLKDYSKKVKPKIFRIADKYRQQISEKLNLYVESGWYIPVQSDDASPTFAVPKSNPSQARMVHDLRERNANTIKDFSPAPDLHSIRERVAKARYRSQFVFSIAYNQIRIDPTSVPYSGVATEVGCFLSNVMHMGDCNAQATLQRLLYVIFRRFLDVFLLIWYDNLFIYSDTARDHARHIRMVLDICRLQKLYLGRNSIEMFTKKMHALGAVITDDGIIVDERKMDKIRKWPTPHNEDGKGKTRLLSFLGTLNFMAVHLPMYAMIAAPLYELTANVPWKWSKDCEEAFTSLKNIVPQCLSPIDDAKLSNGYNLYVFHDASTYGCGSWIGMGTSIETAQPARFCSHKFNRAQRNYFTTDQEMLGLVDAVRSFEDLLLGRPFVAVTDHQSLKHFWSNSKLSARQLRSN
jgi:hypothetical protein